MVNWLKVDGVVDALERDLRDETDDDGGIEAATKPSQDFVVELSPDDVWEDGTHDDVMVDVKQPLWWLLLLGVALVMTIVSLAMALLL